MDKDEILFVINSCADMGIYPAAVSGCGDKDYKERDAFKNGWNAAIMEFTSAVREKLGLYDQPWSAPEKLFIAAGEYEFYYSPDRNAWSIFLNDTWYWACADSELIPKDKYQEVADLFRQYGRAGMLYWVYKIRGECPQFSDYKEMILNVERSIKAQEEYQAKRKKV